MTRIDRYLARELGQTFIAVLAILMLVTMSNGLARLLVSVVEGKIASGVVFSLLGLESLRLLTVVVPLSFFMAIMLALGRMHRDSEMTALMSCGVGPIQIYRPLLMFGLPLIALLAWFALVGAPLTAELRTDLRHRARQEAMVTLLNPGQFRNMQDGKIVAYAEKLDLEEGTMSGVFLYMRDEGKEIVTTALTGRQYIDPVSGARYLVLMNGERVEAIPGLSEHDVLNFKRLEILVREDPQERMYMDREEQHFTELWKSDSGRDHAELHWRLASPVSALALMFLAPVLAHAGPREGRYGRIVLAALIYVLYSNVLSIARVWIERDFVPASLGLWWVHIPVFAISLIVLVHRRHLNLSAMLSPRPKA